MCSDHMNILDDYTIYKMSCCTVYMMLRDPCPMLVKNSQDRKAGKETGDSQELSRTGRQEKKQVLVKISQGSY